MTDTPRDDRERPAAPADPAPESRASATPGRLADRPEAGPADVRKGEVLEQARSDVGQPDGAATAAPAGEGRPDAGTGVAGSASAAADPARGGAGAADPAGRTESASAAPGQGDEAAAVELTVIVVSYNTRDLTLAALRTLFATTKATRMRVVVWDNASEDGSAAAVAAEFPEVELIASDDNIGFAAANNAVAERAGTEWLLLLNPDTEVHAGAVGNLMAFARAHPEHGIYGGRTVFPDGSLNIASCWRRITPWSAFCMATGLTAAFPRSELFNPEAMPSWRRDSVREVDIVVGCFMLIRRELWQRLGGFDLRYWMYGEEADLCARARALGYRPAITPDAQIMHLVGAASRTQAGKRVLLAQARTQLIRDHWPAALVPAGVGLMWLWGALRTAGGRLAGGARRETWDAVWRARGDWLRGYAARPR